MKNASDKLPSCEPILLSAKEAARACDMSLSLWYRANVLGLCPQPAMVCSKKLWDYRLLKLWSLHGCPSRDSAAWQTLLMQLKGNST